MPYKRFKPYMKGFGKSFFACSFIETPDKKEEKWKYRGFVSGAIIGFPVWFTIGFIMSCVDACKDDDCCVPFQLGSTEYYYSKQGKFYF